MWGKIRRFFGSSGPAPAPKPPFLGPQRGWIEPDYSLVRRVEPRFSFDFSIPTEEVDYPYEPAELTSSFALSDRVYLATTTTLWTLDKAGKVLATQTLPELPVREGSRHRPVLLPYFVLDDSRIVWCVKQGDIPVIWEVGTEQWTFLPPILDHEPLGAGWVNGQPFLFMWETNHDGPEVWRSDREVPAWLDLNQGTLTLAKDRSLEGRLQPQKHDARWTGRTLPETCRGPASQFEERGTDVIMVSRKISPFSRSDLLAGAYVSHKKTAWSEATLIVSVLERLGVYPLAPQLYPYAVGRVLDGQALAISYDKEKCLGRLFYWQAEGLKVLFCSACGEPSAPFFQLCTCGEPTTENGIRPSRP